MKPITLVVTVAGVVLGLLTGYSNAGIGGALVYALFWGFGGLLFGRALASTVSLAFRFWNVSLAVVLFVLAVVLTWGVRF